MEPFEIGMWLSGFLIVLVALGIRVAFAAATIGFIGLVRLVDILSIGQSILFFKFDDFES